MEGTVLDGADGPPAMDELAGNEEWQGTQHTILDTDMLSDQTRSGASTFKAATKSNHQSSISLSTQPGVGSAIGDESGLELHVGGKLGEEVSSGEDDCGKLDDVVDEFISGQAVVHAVCQPQMCTTRQGDHISRAAAVAALQLD